MTFVSIFRNGKLILNTMIVYQGEVDNEDKLGSNLETKIDEKPLEDEQGENVKDSIPENSSIAINPIKPVTPVTFPESGTESEDKIVKSDEQDKKKEVNFQPSVDNDAVQAQVLPETESETAIKQDPAETAGLPRQESVSKTEQGAGQTGTAKRKKKKKEKEESESKAGAKKPEIATVVAPYTATSKEQLSLQRGQMILVRKKHVGGWWQGEIQGGKGKKRQLGWFPASYVKMLDSAGEKSDVPVQSTTAETADEKQADNEEPEPTTSSTTGTKFKALFSYGGQHEDELCFEIGDIITLISKDEEAWWKGSTADGRTGVFPSNYVEIIE